MKRIFFSILGLALVVAAAMAGLSHHKSEAATKAAAAPPPAMPVSVMTLQPQSVQTWSEFPGRMQAIDYAEVRPEVGGKVVEVRFHDGQTVKAGDVLLVIDPQPYQAAVAKAEADVNSAQTNEQFAKAEADRANNLIQTQAISRSLADQRGNAERVAQASLQAAQAELTQAKINIDRAYVKAPISGKVSRAEITVGNVVQPGGTAPVLTSITSTGGIYADFDVDEGSYLREMRTASRDGQTIPVDVVVSGDEGHPYHGQIESFDNHIDTATGTIRARAILANDDGSLIPGMTIRARVADPSSAGVLLVPEAAISIDQDKQVIYTVGPDNKVGYNVVELGKANGDKRIVQSGLKAGDKIIVDGVQHVHPGVEVVPKEVAMGAAPPADASATTPTSN